MTDALRKMVEAMAAEFARQRAADDRWNVDYVEHVGPNETVLDGRFDLEKVARAGLAAIGEPPAELDELIAANFVHDMPDASWRGIIAAILKEEP